VAYANWKIIRYFLWLWLIGTIITPIFNLAEPGNLNGLVFMITGWVGYFLLGPYLLRIKLRSWVLCLLFFAGTIWTILGTYIVTGSIGERVGQFFYEFSSISVIMASIALYMLLANFPTIKTEKRFYRANSLLKQISQNTLPIYLFHIMIMESLQRGFIGFQISTTTMNPILEVPIITVITLLLCLGLIYLMKKVPIVRRLIG
jgi:surface polysaccharide O-acyltransferase-like enzyme